MKCQKCGCELRDGAKFCDNCGAAVPQPKEDNPAENHLNNSIEYNETASIEEKKKKYNTGIAILSIVIAVLLILVFIVYSRLCNCNNNTAPKSNYSSQAKEPTTKRSEEPATEKPTEKVTEKTTEKPTEAPTEKETEPIKEEPKIINNTSANGFWAEGDGDFVAQGLNVSGGYAVLHIESYDKGHFSVVTYKNDDYDDLLVNTSDPYSGDVLVVGSGEFELKISAKGGWKITSRGLDIDDTTSFSGSGDAVTGITTHGGGNWKITNNGSGHFSVIEYSLSKGYLSLLANTTGDYNGIDKADKGDDIFFKVSSEGSWTIEKQ